MTADTAADTATGPGSGPAGVPAAIGITPILSARYRPEHLERIRRAAPGARLVSVSLEGLADGPVDDVEVLLRGPLAAGIFERLLVRCPRLVWVHSATAGVERVLTPAARARGVAITNARGVFSQPIAEYVLMMILAVSRRLPHLLDLQRERTWQPLAAVEMRELTIGLVGFGSIGRAVARLARPFGCRLLAVRRGSSDGWQSGGESAPANDHVASRESTGGRALPTNGSSTPPDVDEQLPAERLPELLARSDFVVLALPLTRQTEDLFDAAMLEHIKPGAWLVNVARGRLVDERALVRALQGGRLGGAVLDAFREEPLPADSPLWTLPNAIVTPHTSWSSGHVLDRSIELFCENLERFRRGEPLRNLVDPDLGY